MASNPGEIAKYFGVAPEIPPFLPELLADLSELGSEPELVAEWLRGAGLGGPLRGATI